MSRNAFTACERDYNEREAERDKRRAEREAEGRRLNYEAEVLLREQREQDIAARSEP